MSNILKLVATVGIQYAEQTTVLAEICLKFYLASSESTGTTKEKFTRQVYYNSNSLLINHGRMILSSSNSVVSPAIQAITEGKGKLIKFMDNEGNTYPVKLKMDAAIAVMTKNANSYGVCLATDFFHLVSTDTPQLIVDLRRSGKIIR